MAKRILLVSMITLIIEKGSDAKIPVQVPEYEVGILQDIHGEASVYEVGRDDMQLENPDIQVMFDGLVAKYQSSQDADQARARYFSRAGQLERYLERQQPDAPSASAAAKAKPAAGGRRGAKKDPKDREPAGDAPASEQGDEGSSLTPEQVAELLALPVEQVIARLGALDDADLVALEEAETEGAGREDLLAALDDEAEKRK